MTLKEAIEEASQNIGDMKDTPDWAKDAPTSTLNFRLDGEAEGPPIREVQPAETLTFARPASIDGCNCGCELVETKIALDARVGAVLPILEAIANSEAVVPFCQEQARLAVDVLRWVLNPEDHEDPLSMLLG